MTVADTFRAVFGAQAQLRITAYDGSAAGPSDAPVTLEVRSPDATSALASAPGELGLARAYVGGHLEVHGDVYTALRAVDSLDIGGMSWTDRWDVLRSLGGALLRRTPPPPEEVRRMPGRRHSRRRDAEAIAHHYDVSNRFYEWVLGPSMAYTCAAYPTADATLEQAQEHKHDLVARKLGLQPGMRLLDVGCGWGGMVMHAAERYGVQALGVTLSRQQAEWASKAIADRGLSGLAEVRYLDYRDVPEGDFDAVSSIGLTEHIGRSELGAYFTSLHGKLRPQGRLLNHCIMRPTSSERTLYRRGFINRYVFPDGELLGLGTIAAAMQDNGFEIHHSEGLRVHYAMTLRDWSANLERHWDEAVAEVGEGRARVWRLYLAASRLGFETGHIELHQLLGTRSTDGASGMPLRPDWGV